MKKLLFLALPFLALAQEGSIEGVAINKLTKAPLAGVKVRLTAASDPAMRYEAVTDSNGAYRLANVPPGDYSPSFDAPRGFYPPDPMEMALKRTRIQVTGRTSTFDVELTPAGAIRGRVFDPDGRPVPGAVIVALPMVSIRPGMGRTDETGRFSIPVAPGKYCLQVRPRSAGASPVFYPDVTDMALAETIVVREGGDVGGYDFRLRAPSHRHLRGFIHDNHGKPVPGVEVALATLAGLVEELVKVKSAANGAFEFPSVAAGDWLIRAGASRGGIPWSGKTKVTMPDRDTEGLEVRIDPPFSVDVELEGAPQDRRNPVRFELSPLVGPASDSPVAEQNGRARFRSLYPGTYRLGVYGFIPGYYVKSIWSGTTDLTGRPLELGPDSPPLRVVYAPQPGRIRGEVADGAGAKVVLAWADRDNYVPGTDVFTINCEADGRFNIDDLRPGHWYAFAFAEAGIASTAAMRERVFDRGLWRQAQSVHIGEGETATANLKIWPWLE